MLQPVHEFPALYGAFCLEEIQGAGRESIAKAAEFWEAAAPEHRRLTPMLIKHTLYN
jgi:hypothetical protein